MTMLSKKIEHPFAAIIVIVLLGALLNKYGITHGSLLIFDLFGGIAIYKVITE